MKISLKELLSGLNEQDRSIVCHYVNQGIRQDDLMGRRTVSQTDYDISHPKVVAWLERFVEIHKPQDESQLLTNLMSLA